LAIFQQNCRRVVLILNLPYKIQCDCIVFSSEFALHNSVARVTYMETWKPSRLLSMVMADRSLLEHALRVLVYEWEYPSCCVPVLRALIDDCSFRSTIKFIQKEVREKE